MADNPEEVFTRLFNKWANRWAIIFSFREVATAGLPYAAKVVSATRARWAQEIAADPEWERIFSDKERFLKAGGPEAMARELTRLALENARQSADAASVVFAHSILDDMALDCCKIIAWVDRSAVEREVERRRVELRMVRERGYDAVRDELLDGFVADLGKDSLIRKVDFIFEFCRPPHGWAAMRGYQFDRDRLVRLDNLRHDIVHGEALSTPIFNVDDDLDYMNRTGMHFIGLINHRYGLEIDPAIAVGKSRTAPADGRVARTEDA